MSEPAKRAKAAGLRLTQLQRRLGVLVVSSRELFGLDTVGYLTNESAFELKELSRSLMVLGGRFIALEIAQMFSQCGTDVTVLQRSDRILPNESEDLTGDLTGDLEGGGLRVVTGCTLSAWIGAATE